jgi:MFS family permease
MSGTGAGAGSDKSVSARPGRSYGPPPESPRSCPGYVSYITGVAITATGSWGTQLGLLWLMLQFTDDGRLLGLLAALQYLPYLGVGLLAGMAADRFPVRRLIVAVEGTLAVLIGALAALTVADLMTVPLLLMFAFVIGCVSVLEFPARQVFLGKLVSPTAMPRAVRINAVVSNASRVAGPAVAGLLIATVGTEWALIVDALSYLVFLALLPRGAKYLERASMTRPSVSDGLRYVRAHGTILRPLLLLAVIGTLTLNFQVLTPLLVREQLHSDASLFGLLIAVMGAGSIAAGVLPRFKSRADRDVLVGGVVLGLSTVAVAVTGTAVLAGVVFFVIGIGRLLVTTGLTTTLQLGAAPAQRGRVMALYSLIFSGTSVMGAPYATTLATVASPAVAFAAAGVVCVIAVGVIRLVPDGPVAAPETSPQHSSKPAGAAGDRT